MVFLRILAWIESRNPHSSFGPGHPRPSQKGREYMVGPPLVFHMVRGPCGILGPYGRAYEPTGHLRDTHGPTMYSLPFEGIHMVAMLGLIRNKRTFLSFANEFRVCKCKPILLVSIHHNRIFLSFANELRVCKCKAICPPLPSPLSSRQRIAN
ncbi:hypothetical protein T484DRAFT_2308779 [Baffinella frigidus]|nr:hypothetical protein T484DRAFT_2308779 [Cryptophyta sp. CCMP2293]